MTADAPRDAHGTHGTHDTNAAQGACDRCLARSWLLVRTAGHLDQVRRRIDLVLALSDGQLIDAIGGRQRGVLRRELDQLELDEIRAHAGAAGLEMLCRCHPSYPTRLAALAGPPAVLYIAGGVERLLALLRADPVAIVGTRRPSGYGTEMAAALGRGLARAGVTVLSGMALGIDSAAHAGALATGAPTVAVLPGSPDRPYPAGKRALHRRILAAGAAVSELGPGVAVRRWMFPARNRIIAGLSAATIVVEAGERSGALLTAGFARDLGRPIGAVPGRVTTAQAAGPNRLLAEGAYAVRGAQDVLDQLFGAGVREADDDDRPELAPELRVLLAAIAEGRDTPAALTRAGIAADHGLAALAALELAGYIRRGAGGRFSVVP
ncbi:MAG: DNA-protecting protein DprA [Solirubrobacterales bacterium]|nr:DNA-protecting protein DprA [Solirubrobacterales bacterium]